MEELEIKTLDKVIEIIEEILDFACFRDGDRLASKDTIVFNFMTH